MTHNFNTEETKKFFDGQVDWFSTVRSPREKIFFDIILPKVKESHTNKINAIDFGCGSGELVIKLNNKGINTYGIEKHNKLYNVATKKILENGYKKELIINGDIKELDKFESGSVDIIILMGVFQYLSEDDYNKIFNVIHRILKDKGHLIGTFQNAFFDLFTFNKYTLDFYKEKFIKPLFFDKKIRESIYKDLRKLITNPDKPDQSLNIARDNIYVRTTNPITINDELEEKKIRLIGKYFYDFHFIPRLIEKKYENDLKELTKAFEVKKSTEWYGYFMANAFVVDCIKI